MFDHPLYVNSGNLFWPDAWQGKVSDTAYSMHGLRPEDAKVTATILSGLIPRPPCKLTSLQMASQTMYTK